MAIDRRCAGASDGRAASDGHEAARERLTVAQLIRPPSRFALWRATAALLAAVPFQRWTASKVFSLPQVMPPNA